MSNPVQDFLQGTASGAANAISVWARRVSGVGSGSADAQGIVLLDVDGTDVARQLGTSQTDGPALKSDPALQYVMPATIGGVNAQSASLAATTSTPITFAAPSGLTGQQLRRIILQNKTNAESPQTAGWPVYYDIDQAASPGSFVVLPGQRVEVFVRPNNNLTLYASNSTPINGSATGNIVVRGGY